MEAYTYRIDFENGDYYFGWKSLKGDPESDGYFGTPVTFKHRWEEDIYCKTVLALHETREIARQHESYLIGDKHRTDSHCLNAANNIDFCFHHTKEWRRRKSESMTGVKRGKYKPRKNPTKKRYRFDEKTNAELRIKYKKSAAKANATRKVRGTISDAKGEVIETMRKECRSIYEIAQMLEISKSTVYNYLKANKMITFRR